MTRRDIAHASVRRGDRRVGEVGESSAATPSDPVVDSPPTPRAEIHPPSPPQPDVHPPPPPPPQPEVHPPPPPQDSFPGGPDDLSLLTQYRDHEAAYVWRGEGRPDLRPISHGKKILDFLPTDRLRECLDRIRLRPLLMCTYPVIDKGLIAAMVERWHPETCTFHLPVGEMSITLDDVACLTNLPIDGEFFSPSKLVRSTAIPILEQELQLSFEEAKAETDATRGPAISFAKLKTICQEAIEAEAAAEDAGEEVVAEGQLRVSEKAYIVFLVGCLLLPDKSGDAVPVSYFSLVHSEQRASSFSWGGILLASLFAHLSDACLHKCKQISGCLGLLQAWIYVHLPQLASHKFVDIWTPELPVMASMDPLRGTGKLDTYRAVLETLTARHVVWTPYEPYREHHPLTDRALYSGFIRVGSRVYRLLPERVLRQFGYVQTIPSPPPNTVSVDVCDQMWHEWEMYQLDELLLTRVTGDDPGACASDYMQWFLGASHPWMLESSYIDHAHLHQPIVLPDVVTGTSSEDWQRVTGLAERLVRSTTRGTPAWDIGRAILAIASQHASERRVRPRR